jgi:hypothetical protein
MAIGNEKTLMLTVMRNEGPYILEWVAHHFALGIDDLLIFTNFCTDNTDKILDRIEVLWPHRVKHQPNPKVMFPKQGMWHIMALRYAGHFGRYQAADWLYVTDADEFLNLRNDAGTLDGFFEDAGPADAVSFTSVAFNSNGHKYATDDLVTTRYTQTTADLDGADQSSKEITTAVKTLYRNTIKGPRRPHRPVTKTFSTTGFKWINGSGEEMPASFTDSDYKGINAIPTRVFGQVNHYSIKSAAEFLLKVDRGDAVQADRLGASEQYWKHANRTGGTDTSNVGLSPAAQEIYDFLKADPVLAELHAQSLDQRQTRLTEILKTEGGQDLARRIGYYD